MPLRRGFTLVEVLVALVIFALTAVVLGSAYLNVLNGYEIARKANMNDEDVFFARSQLLSQADLQTAQNGAEFDDGDRHVRWTAEIEQGSTTDLFSVTFTCTVTGGVGVEARTVVENFMLVRPTWSDPTTRSTLRQNAADRIALVQGKQAQ
ncbi:MAG: prepilin-type N-terminal cleavage/methylation domain-containing protein [Opitutaceae bacterium]|jgi:prepilin-type N-terminal cleavage/methylation domain-containing protein